MAAFCPRYRNPVKVIPRWANRCRPVIVIAREDRYRDRFYFSKGTG